MEDQITKGKNYTVGALVLHTLVLFWMNSLTLGGSFFFIWGFLAIAVTGKHYRDTMKPIHVQIWAGLHLVISLYFLYNVAWLSFGGYSLYQAGLLPLIVFVTPPIAIMFFARSERT